MKKALQSYAFRAEVSLAARAVVSGACEAHPRSFFDRLAEMLGGDPSRQLVRRPRVLERRLRRRPPPEPTLEHARAAHQLAAGIASEHLRKTVEKAARMSLASAADDRSGC